MTAADDVKSRIDIVDLVSEHVSLRKAGRNFVGLCPFHTEKTPSFNVSPDRQTWHCFGACSTGGDVFNFVMKRQNIDFGEALRVLAERAGVNLTATRSPEEDERRERLLHANEAAAAFFHNALRSKPGATARSYLDSRGLDDATIEAFELGFGPDAWEALKSHLIERGFPEQELLDAGLLVEGERGGYDRFRNRLVFPIRDERGRVCGFGGRALEPSDGAKYVNTPQTAVFDKSSILYALDRAKEAVRRHRQVIVVEGYMDAIAAHQHGIRNVVASMGTAVTEKQMRTLERYKCQILLAMDADPAGVEATLRALREAAELGMLRGSAQSVHPDELAEADFSDKIQQWSQSALKRAVFNCHVIALSGKDPDEMIRADRAAWDAAVENVKPFLDHVFGLVASRLDLSEPNGRIEMIAQLAPFVRLIDEPVLRAHWVQRLATKARVSEKAVQAELKRVRAQPPRKSEATNGASVPTRAVQRDKTEEFILALLFRYPQLHEEGCALSLDLFALGENAALFEAWRVSPDPQSLGVTLPEELRGHYTRVCLRELPVLDGEELGEALGDCVRRIELRRLSAAKQASTASIANRAPEEDLRTVVSQAREALERNGENGSSIGDTEVSAFARALVEDMEKGQQLHRPAQNARQEEPQSQSPPPEDGST